MNIKDCITCEYAQRDKHNRFVDPCLGYSNCSYSEFKGEIKPTLRECIDTLNKNIVNTDENYLYKKGFRDAFKFIKNWDDAE